MTPEQRITELERDNNKLRHEVALIYDRAIFVMLLLRCEAELGEGCSKDTAVAMGKFMRGEI